jgi:hypothetical protein
MTPGVVQTGAVVETEAKRKPKTEVVHERSPHAEQAPAAVENSPHRGMLALQRSVGNRTVTAMLQHGVPPIRHGPRMPWLGATVAPPIQRADIRGQAQEPESADQTSVLGAIAPGAYTTAPPPPTPVGSAAPATAPPARARWTGSAESGQPMRREQWVARRELKAALRAELVRQLDAVIVGIRQRAASYSARRIPTARFEGPGEAAKVVTDQVVGAYTASAALTPTQAAARHAHRFSASGSGRNLLDAYDPQDRRLTGSAVSAESVLWWMVDQGNAPSIKEAQNFTPSDWNAQEKWLYHQVINPVARSRGADLRLFDRFGFALAPGRGRVLIGAMADAQGGNPGNAAPTPLEERIALWDGWQTLVHEYIHTLEHPTHLSARGASPASTVLNEGMTEYFTKQVLDRGIPQAQADEALRRQVEGLAASDPAPPLTPDVMAATYNYNATYRPHVNRILQIVPTVREEGLRAAFFQGHVEYLGITTAGQPGAPVAAGTGGGITIPSSVASLADLSALTAVAESDIRAANPSVASWSSMPARAIVPDWREHRVVQAGEGSTGTAETPDQIATQHGISVSELERVNQPLIGRWPRLRGGDRVLVPPSAPAAAAAQSGWNGPMASAGPRGPQVEP